MGSAPKPRSGLADALLTPVQQRVLGVLFGQPDRTYQSAELIRLARSGTGAVHRQLSRLEAAGLLTATRVGNQKHYQARRDSPVFAELHGLRSRRWAWSSRCGAPWRPGRDSSSGGWA